MRNQFFFSVLALGTFASLSSAALVVTDIEALSDAGGVWRNSTSTNPGPNWAVWASNASVGSVASPGPFLNDAGVVDVGPPQRDNPNGAFALPDGVTTLRLYKNAYASQDQGTKFSLSNGSTGSITVVGGNYNAGTTPDSANVTTTVGDRQVRITAFDWFTSDNTNYTVDIVGDTDHVGAGSGPDNYGLVTFNVTPVPEPAALGLLFGGSLLLAGQRRR